ncbi:MAG: ABC transporter ATP-binding protein [Promethearchaeota archaeon]
MTETVIKLENICKRFGKFLAVNNISLEINRGEIIGFVGPNGAGKTTTLKLIARLMTPNSGKIFVINKQGKLQNLSENPKNLVEMGFLIDIPHFYNSTPYLVLKYIANIRNYPKEKLDHFSKGMIQKLGFIAAIIHDPEIIILDEPQTGLDPNARIDVRKYMRFLQNQDKTIFVASHMLYEISEVCDKIALINQGSIITFDALDNIEYLLKTKEIVCEILKPIPPEEKDLLLTRLIQSLEPYLEKNLDPSISKKPILYNPQEKSFIIYYDGKEDSRANILDILVNEFKSDFTINSFSKPKTSQLERLYTQMIRNNEFKAKLNRK